MPKPTVTVTRDLAYPGEWIVKAGREFHVRESMEDAVEWAKVWKPYHTLRINNAWKLHKIPGVDKAVCTAEQKIAYNIAFDSLNWLQRLISDGMDPGEAFEYVFDCQSKAYDRQIKRGKYDKDAVFAAFRANMEAYSNAKYKICSSYEAIGEIFRLPATPV